MIARAAPAVLAATLAACPRAGPPTTPARDLDRGDALELCTGRAVRESVRPFTLRPRAVLDGAGVARLAVRGRVIQDATGRVWARRTGNTTVRLEADGLELTLDGDILARPDGRRVAVGGDGAVVVANPGGEFANTPWNLQCSGQTRAASLLALLLLDGLDRAEAPAPQGEREP